MRERLLLAASTLWIAVFFPGAVWAQSSAPIDKKVFVQHVNSLYYRPAIAGLTSFSCAVKFDWDSVPASILLPAEIAGRAPLEQTKLVVTVHYPGAVSTQHELPQDTLTVMRPVYDKFFGVLSNILSGFLQTWGTKYLNGPIPEERFVTGVTTIQDGYVMTASNIPAQFQFSLSPDYKLKEMVTKGPDGDIDEHTIFSSSPQGFVITANDGISQSGRQATHMQYEMTYQMMQGFSVPKTVRLKVDDSIDTRFSFDNCSIQKGIVIQVSPPFAR